MITARIFGRGLPAHAMSLHGRRIALAMMLGVSLVHCASGDERPNAALAKGGAGGGSTGASFAEQPEGEVELCPSSQCKKPFADCNRDVVDGCEVDLRTDPLNCGACGVACVHGEQFCGDGVCQTECRQDNTCGGHTAWADCDGALGCETQLLNDPQNCGACGVVCPPGVRCFEGSCGCPGNKTTCGDLCVDLQSDVLNCGACGNACTDPILDDDQIARCVDGACKVGCNEACGLFDCDDNPATACITVNSNEHCGACNAPCPPGSPCMGSVCCDTTKLDADPGNCGACGLRCIERLLARFSENHPLGPDGVVVGSFLPGCANGECFATCTGSYGDCNGDLALASSDGCETNLTHDPANCGACGASCAEGQVCLHGKCAQEPCGNQEGGPR